MSTLFKECKELKVLKLRNCLSISGLSFCGPDDKIRATRLEVVEFAEGFGFRDADVRALALAAPALRELVLESDVKFTNLDGSLAFLAAKCRKLEKLEASSCGIIDRTVLTFAACCKGLTKLSFNSEPFLTDSGVHSLAALRGLESLELWDCPQVTGTALGSCQSLKRLLLGNLPELRESSLAHLTMNLRAILMLACYDCPQVTDTIVEKLLRSPTAPPALVFRGAPLLTRRGLDCLAKEVFVRRMCFSNCPAIEEAVASGFPLPANVTFF